MEYFKKKVLFLLHLCLLDFGEYGSASGDCSLTLSVSEILLFSF